MKKRPRHCRGFTLIEMVTSLVILAVLLVACGSILRMATQATGDSATRNGLQLQAADAAGRIADDLNVAINFTQRTATSATFTVPDRLNAGAPQAVTYAWSGTAGDPLLRTFNGGTPAAVLGGVSKFSFDFATRTLGTAAVTEQRIFEHTTVGGTLKDYTVTDQKWAAQQFTPALPSSAASYSISRVRVALKAGAQDAVMAVSIRTASTLGQPTSTVLGQATVYVSALSTQYEWVDVPFSGVSGLNPSQSIAVVVGYASGGTAAGSLQYDQALLALLAGANWSTSSDAGASWSGLTSLAAGRMVVYATVP